MPNDRIPLQKEPISGTNEVLQYDRGARFIMAPQYKYFVRKILRKGIRKGRVLDIGTGSGLLAIELARVKNTDFHVTGIDVSSDMVVKAIDNSIKSGTETKTEFITANASTIPFPVNYFDLVISYASLHHWREPISVFNEIARVTKNRGTIIIRDNVRVSNSIFWKSAIWLFTRIMNKRHRDNFPKVIRSCYTISEIAEVLQKSNLRNCRVSRDFIGVDISIESP